MSRFSKLETLKAIEEVGLVPVFYVKDNETAKNIVSACAKGGAKIVEMTNRGDGAIEVYKELEKHCIENHPDIILGVGSVIDAPTAALYIAYGANFVVGPLIDEETAILCNKRKIPYSPGCATASEVHKAHSLGVDICKIFPGDLIGGPSFVKAIKGPCPWFKCMPTGGVSPTKESLAAWFSSGVVAVGIGSNLITKEILKNKDYGKLEQDIRDVISLIRDIRKNL